MEQESDLYNLTASESKRLHKDGLISGWGAFVGVLSTLALLQVEQIDIPLTVSILCFAVSIPLSTTASAMAQYYASDKIILKRQRFFIQNLGVGGFFILAIGIGGIFWHFSISAGITFLCVFLFMMGVYTMAGVNRFEAVYRGDSTGKDVNSS